MSFAATYIDLEIILSEVSQRQISQYCLYMETKSIDYTYELIYEIEIDPQT